MSSRNPAPAAATIRWEVEPLAALAPHRARWKALADAALDPNPFYEPDYLLASLHLAPKQALQVLVGRSPDNAEWLALFPLRKAGWREGWRPGLLALVHNPYTPLTTPLLRREGAETILASLFEAVPRLFPGSALLLPMLPALRPFAGLWQQLLAARGLASRDLSRESRAAIETEASFEAYTGKHHQSLLRRERKLATHGSLHYQLVEGHTVAGAAMLEAFLAIEASGWKGRRRTALASRPETADFARQAFAGHAPATLIECLRLNEQPIAVNINLLAGGVLYTVKSAYDEDFRGYSPGNLLDRHTIALATGIGPIRRVDSCALPGHPLEQSWHEREIITRQLVDWSGSFGQAGLGRMAAWLAASEKAIHQLARWRNMMRRG